jgi:hypothetical protein
MQMMATHDMASDNFGYCGHMRMISLRHFKFKKNYAWETDRNVRPSMATGSVTA